MSANLMGYLVVGPRNFEADALIEARAAEAKMRAQVTEVEGLLEAVGEDYPGVSVEYPEWVPDENGDREVDWDELVSALDAGSVVDMLLNVWRVRYDDVLYRWHPRNEELAIVFAGGGAWDDTPDGDGYRALKAADIIGLFPILGID